MASSDDLLDMLSELEEHDSPQQTPQKPAPAEPKTQRGDTTHAQNITDVLLEATEQAQTAADLAQVATERTLHLSKEQKENIIEMSEALGAWRHATRSALKELKREQTKSTVMLAMTALLAAGTLGGGGFMLYQVKKQVEIGKADILDLIQTQLAMESQKTRLKIDELASVLETLQVELKNELKKAMVAANTPQAPVHIQSHDHAIAPDTSNPQPIPVSVKHISEAHAEAPHSAHETAPGVHEQPAHHAMTVEASAHHTEASTHAAPHAHIATSALDEAKWKQLNQAIETLKHQLQQLLRAQQSSHHRPVVQTAYPSRTLEEMRKLLVEQQKQLKIIRAALWKLRQQQQHNKQATPAPQQHASTHDANLTLEFTRLSVALERLTQQIAQLKQQQAQMRKELQSLKNQTKGLIEERSYFYKAPPLNVE